MEEVLTFIAVSRLGGFVGVPRSEVVVLEERAQVDGSERALAPDLVLGRLSRLGPTAKVGFKLA